jgi:hypothetical protein
MLSVFLSWSRDRWTNMRLWRFGSRMIPNFEPPSRASWRRIVQIPRRCAVYHGSWRQSLFKSIYIGSIISMYIGGGQNDLHLAQSNFNMAASKMTKPTTRPDNQIFALC